MAFHKYELTTHKDHFIGTKSSDVFEAPLQTDGTATLSSDDILNGGAGRDKLVASFFEGKIAAVMNNIETGVFATDEAVKVGLDLAHASAMKNLVFKQNHSDIAHTKMRVTHAEHVTSIRLQDADDNMYVVDGVDPSRSMTITADNSDESGINLIGMTNAHYSDLNITVSDGSFLGLFGDNVLARTVTINSTGSAGNAVSFNNGDSGIHHLIVSGSTSINLNSQADTFAHLNTFDASGMYAAFSTNIGGHALTSVRGGGGGDVMAIETIGGSRASRTEVDMGAGDDHLLLQYGFDAKTQHYDGGAGTNTLTVTGHLSHLGEGIENFQVLEIEGTTGFYNLAKTGVQSIEVHVSKAVSFNHLPSDTEMTIDLESAATIGNSKTGFSAAGLHYAGIISNDIAHDMYLASLGSQSKAADLGIAGTTHVTLHETDDAKNYIQQMDIMDSAGVDISGISSAFAAGGATIWGGDGDDVLVGGDGEDIISTGEGSNTVIGSLGADVVNLLVNSGADDLVFNNQTQSAYGTGHDTVNNFGTFDGIDLTALGDITYVGNATDLGDGISKLSTSHASAFFDMQDHTLYVDLDHDKQLTSAHDMAIQLNGVDSFSVGSLIG